MCRSANAQSANYHTNGVRNNTFCTFTYPPTHRTEVHPPPKPHTMHNKALDVGKVYAAEGSASFTCCAAGSSAEGTFVLAGCYDGSVVLAEHLSLLFLQFGKKTGAVIGSTTRDDAATVVTWSDRHCASSTCSLSSCLRSSQILLCWLSASSHCLLADGCLEPIVGWLAACQPCSKESFICYVQLCVHKRYNILFIFQGFVIFLCLALAGLKSLPNIDFDLQLRCLLFHQMLLQTTSFLTQPTSFLPSLDPPF